MDTPTPTFASSAAQATMTSEELLERSSSWTLACDNALLNKLKDFSDNISKQSEGILQACETLSNQIDLLNYRVQTVGNQFLMLSNTQFMENRVEEFQETMNLSTVRQNLPVKTKSEKEAELISKMKEAIQIGVAVKTEQELKLNVEVASDSVSVLPQSGKLKLPHIIGTSKFFSSRYCGLVDEMKIQPIISHEPEIDVSVHNPPPEGYITQPEPKSFNVQQPLNDKSDGEGLFISNRELYQPPSINKPLRKENSTSSDEHFIHEAPSTATSSTSNIAQHCDKKYGSDASSLSDDKPVPKSLTDELNARFRSRAPPPIENDTDESDEDFRQLPPGQGFRSGIFIDEETDDFLGENSLFRSKQAQVEDNDDLFFDKTPTGPVSNLFTKSDLNQQKEKFPEKSEQKFDTSINPTPSMPTYSSTTITPPKTSKVISILEDSDTDDDDLFAIPSMKTKSSSAKGALGISSALVPQSKKPLFLVEDQISTTSAVIQVKPEVKEFLGKNTENSKPAPVESEKNSKITQGVQIQKPEVTGFPRETAEKAKPAIVESNKVSQILEGVQVKEPECIKFLEEKLISAVAVVESKKISQIPEVAQFKKSEVRKLPGENTYKSKTNVVESEATQVKKSEVRKLPGESTEKSKTTVVESEKVTQVFSTPKPQALPVVNKFAKASKVDSIFDEFDTSIKPLPPMPGYSSTRNTLPKALKGKSIFEDSDSDNDDLFATSSMKAKSSGKISELSITSAQQPKKSLFLGEDVNPKTSESIIQLDNAKVTEILVDNIEKTKPAPLETDKVSQIPSASKSQPLPAVNKSPKMTKVQSIFDESDSDDDLFSGNSAKVKSFTRKPEGGTTASISALKHQPRKSIFDESDDEDIFSRKSNQQNKSSMQHEKQNGDDKNKTDETSVDGKDLSMEVDKKSQIDDVAEPRDKKSAKEVGENVPGTTSKNFVKSVAHTLKINPLALRPGAKLPSSSNKNKQQSEVEVGQKDSSEDVTTPSGDEPKNVVELEKGISFDDSVVASALLPSVAKTRARMLPQRRPPSRKPVLTEKLNHDDVIDSSSAVPTTILDNDEEEEVTVSALLAEDAENDDDTIDIFGDSSDNE